MADISSDQARIVVSGLSRDVENVVKKICLDIVANLSKAPQEGGTPVDTGWARANWLASVGEPVLDAVGSKDNVGAASSAKAAGIGSVLGYKLSKGSAYITNNVPYITDLNEGSSSKAPEGFVQRAIQAAVVEVNIR